MNALSPADLESFVAKTVAEQSIVDMHTHLYPPAFGTPVANGAQALDPAGMMLWGMDELLTYHYLVAEVYRVVPATVLPYEKFWKMSKRQQADHIWKNLFIENSPVSEACRGVITTLSKLGMDCSDRSLNNWRAEEAKQNPSRYVDRVMELAKVESITMTNPVFDDNERARWLNNPDALRDPRFKAVLRIDLLLRDAPTAMTKLAAWDYSVAGDLSETTISEARRFLREWIDRQQAIYLAVSLPPEWRYPAVPGDTIGAAGQTMLDDVILPVCAEYGLAFAMMIGARTRVNRDLRDAGDMGGQADVMSVVNLCRAFPQNRFFVTMLALENQHELAVAARKFGNLMPFGCWWFMNIPSLIEEITTLRLELLGTSFIPQHSDARVLDQLVYKWSHSRAIITTVLQKKYRELAAAGWKIERSEIQRDVRLLLRDNFLNFLQPA